MYVHKALSRITYTRPQRALAVNKVGHLAAMSWKKKCPRRPLFQSCGCARVHILMPQSMRVDAVAALYVIVNEVNLIELHVALA